jgi:hypothetical protein
VFFRVTKHLLRENVPCIFIFSFGTEMKRTTQTRIHKDIVGFLSKIQIHSGSYKCATSVKFVTFPLNLSSLCKEGRGFAAYPRGGRGLVVEPITTYSYQPTKNLSFFFSCVRLYGTMLLHCTICMSLK